MTDDSSSTMNPDSTTADASVLSVRSGITAVAQVKSILECIPVTPDSGDIERRICDLLGLEMEDPDLEGSTTFPPTSVDLRDVLADIPAPDGLIRDIMTKLFVITVPEEHGAGGGGGVDDTVRVGIAIAAPSLLLKAWRDIVAVCDEAGVGLNEHQDDQWLRDAVSRRLQNQQNGKPSSTNTTLDTRRETTLVVNTVSAVWKRFHTSKDVKAKEADDTDMDRLSEPGISTSTTASWDVKGLSVAVGRWILEAQPADERAKGLELDSFVDEWRDALPKPWRVHCNASRLLCGDDAIGNSERERRGRIEIIKQRKLASGRGSAQIPAERGADDDEGGEEEQIIKLVGSALGYGSGYGRDGQDIIFGGMIDDSNGAGPVSGTKTRPPVEDAKDVRKRKWHEKFGAQRDRAKGVKK
jgi:hypothetical protein